MISMKRRTFIQSSLMTAGSVRSEWGGGGRSPLLTPKTENGVDWYDVQQWGIEGRGFGDTESYFDRLPARAKGRYGMPFESKSA